MPSQHGLARKLTSQLYAQVLLGVGLGILLGWLFPTAGIAMKPLADGFIKLIKMLIAPIIFCTVVNGIAGMNDLKHAGRVGLKALIYFEAMTTVALLIGLMVAHIHQPGAGLHIDATKIDASSISAYTSKAAETQTASEFFLHMIPTSVIDAFAKGDILQVLVVAIIFACALIGMGEKGVRVHSFIGQLSDVLFRMMGFIVKLAPIGAFAAMAFAVGAYGVTALGALLELMLSFYATCILFIGIALGIVMRLCGLRIFAFLKYIKDEIILVLGTSSSEAALPRLMEKMRALGCKPAVVDMVVPTGYSFNLDGTSIYLTMAALFVAAATGVHLTLMQEITLLGVLLLTSKGAAGVTGSGFIVLAGTLSAVGNIPVEGLALILGIDRFMSEARAITNLIGNGVATIVVAKWEGALDLPKARRQLALR
jgi:aerobic C4-dicarboxylate transport protein